MAIDAELSAAARDGRPVGKLKRRLGISDVVNIGLIYFGEEGISWCPCGAIEAEIVIASHSVVLAVLILAG